MVLITSTISSKSVQYCNEAKEKYIWTEDMRQKPRRTRQKQCLRCSIFYGGI